MRLRSLSWVFFLVSFLFFVFGNQLLPVTDPVESNYALTAKEMVLSGDWMSPQIYGQYWFDKPVMIYWFIALSYKLFGFTDFAARLPSALFGALSVGLLYSLVKVISGRRLLAAWSAIILGTSLQFWVLAHGIVTDMVLMYATIGTMIYAYRGLTEERVKYMVIAYAFAGVGMLTKGPVAIVLPGLLLMVYALLMRSGAMLKRLFPWQGILAFLAVILPWYGYMYAVHGQTFIDGFLGLHNVVRATQSEHPKDNHWWYYLALFPVASLPWTGAIVYGMWYGWRERQPFYVYAMVMGWGTIAFYTAMATKYPTYAFVSLIPFSILGAVGAVRLLLYQTSRGRWWLLLGPTLFLWIGLFVGSFFAPWGFWYAMQAIVLVATVFLMAAYVRRKGFIIPFVIALGTVFIAGAVIHEGLRPLITLRSSAPIVQTIGDFQGDVYYYGGYSTSIPYYTDKPMTRVSVKAYNDMQAAKEQRSASWNKKDTTPFVEEQVFSRSVKKGSRLLLVVPKNGDEFFESSDIFPYFIKVDGTARETVYVTR